MQSCVTDRYSSREREHVQGGGWIEEEEEETNGGEQGPIHSGWTAGHFAGYVSGLADHSHGCCCVQLTSCFGISVAWTPPVPDEA